MAITMLGMLGALAAPARAGLTVFSDDFSGFSAKQPWADDSIHGGWRSVYNGYGTVEVVNTPKGKVLKQVPMASTQEDETHASLVTTVLPVADMDMTVRMKTVKPVRTPSPNPWETAWLLWRYTDDEHFYYFIPKPNGWELGKEDPAYPGAQRFLATGNDKKFPIKAWYTVRVRHVGQTMTVWVDGDEIVTFTDEERPYFVGSVGLYNEDAAVRFDDVNIALP